MRTPSRRNGRSPSISVAPLKTLSNGEVRCVQPPGSQGPPAAVLIRGWLATTDTPGAVKAPPPGGPDGPALTAPPTR
jgi:hypothetical protein